MAMWSDTAKNPQLFFLDARVAVVFMVFFLHMSLWTFVFSFVTSLVLSILPFFGVDLKNLWRQVVIWIAGKRLQAETPEWVILRRMRTQFIVPRK
ncbi:IcmT/TraK family protein [Acidithiobacillus sp. IBUN Pt1247-S3]|uniref:IcmT/TraK family protein n=1 Tax=Acidithiobacillus sp. IBUN Pt1247-S3 TaxID=3166642 RepID=UPI0034E463EB